MEQVVLVDVEDNPIGTMEKMEAHRKGLLHRAFSILLFNKRGELLLQKRSAAKYHSGSLWTNTCCSHPLPGEPMESATRRKLIQEMGIDTTLVFAYKFVYKILLDNNLTEHECDHVFVGQFDGIPAVNPAEVEDWRHMDLASIRQDIHDNPAHYTEWFKLIMLHPQLQSIAI